MPVDISEYSALARDIRNDAIQTGNEPARAMHQVAVGAGSVQSSVFDDATTLIRVHTDVACRIQIGSNPTAAATTMRLAANSTEFFGVKGGHRLAAITST